MTTPSAEPAASGGGPTAVGPVVGGRFQIEHAVSEDALGAVLAAKDQKTNKPIALRMLRKGLLEGAAASEALRAGVRTAAALPHKNLVAAFGAGQDPRAGWYVASEWVEGQTLSQLMDLRRANGLGGMSLRGAVDVAQQLCAALTAAHRKTMHGGVRPSVVWIAKNGRVKLGDLGVTRALLKSVGAAAFGPTEQAWFAPEVKTGTAPDPKSDVFGIGAVLYAMLSGRSPAEDFVPPSKTHPSANVALDQVLLACLDADPQNRFETPAELLATLTSLAADAPSAATNDLTGEPEGQDFDIDIGSIRPRASAAAAQGPALPRPPAPPRVPGPPAIADARPKIGQRVAASEQFRPSAPGAARATPAPAQPDAPAGTPAGAPSGAAAVDLASLLAKITENDAPRWMVVKDNLDHGPFSGRELVQSILKGEVLETHGLLNMDTGERRKVREFPEFVEFLEQYILRKNEAEEKVALDRSETVQKAGNAAKLLVALAVLGVIGLGVGIFIVTRPNKGSERVTDSNLADLYERGQINITGTAGILPPPPRGSGRRGAGHGGGGGPGGMTYEEAMNQAVNLGDVSGGGGGERQLTPGDVAGVMNRNLNSLFSCVSAELRSGGSLSNVQIDLAIAGSGQVLGASSRQGSTAFKNCIGGRARNIRFPTFPAPRMGARYSFSVD